MTGPKGYETFELQFLKVTAPGCDTSAFRSRRRTVLAISEMSFETLPIAKAQAHADVGIEYVEWEPCNIEITNEDGSIDWEPALPMLEHDKHE
jgi:hypothetical protein